MSPFEYHIAMVSVVVGLGIAHALNGLLTLILRRGSVNWSWVPLIWTLTIILWTIFFWWFTFGRSEVEHLVLLHLLFVLGYAAALYFLLGLLYPAGHEAEVDMWSHFEAHRVWFFSVFFVLGALDFIDTIWFSSFIGAPPLMYWVLLAAWIIGSAVALIVRERRYHSAYALVMVVLIGLQTVVDLRTFSLRPLYPGG